MGPLWQRQAGRACVGSRPLWTPREWGSWRDGKEGERAGAGESRSRPGNQSGCRQERDKEARPIDAPQAQGGLCWWPEGGGRRAHEGGEDHAGEVQDQAPPGAEKVAGNGGWLRSHRLQLGSAAGRRRRWSTCGWSVRPWRWGGALAAWVKSWENWLRNLESPWRYSGPSWDVWKMPVKQTAADNWCAFYWWHSEECYPFQDPVTRETLSLWLQSHLPADESLLRQIS